MSDVQTLVDAMRLGRLPDWAAMVTMNVGDEIAAMIDRVDEGDELERDVRQAAVQLVPETETMGAASALSVILARFDTMKAQSVALRASLVAFGALDADDDVTDPIALLGFLLPPDRKE